MSPPSGRPSTPLPPPPVPPEPLTAPPPLRDRNFALLSWARAISVLGNAFARVALAFAVLALPGATPGRLSLVLACQLLPQVLFVLVGGVIADRIPRIRLMVVAELTGAAAYGGLAAMSLTGHAPLPALAVLAAAAGTATALFVPAMTAVVPEIVARERLTEANAALRMGMNVATVLGLSLSGVVVAGAGAGWALALDALTFLASAALTAGIRPARAHRRRGGPGLRDLRDGWREFASRQWLWAVVLQYAFVVAAQSAAVGALGPLASQEDSGGVREWSCVVAAQAVGTIAGAGLAGRLRPRRPILVAVLATFPAALPMALLGLHAPVWPTAAAAFAAGVAGDVFGVLWATALQRDVPAEALSRVSSYDVFGSLACAPLGTLAAGPLATAAGPRAGLLCCAAVVVAATAAVLLSPEVRRGGAGASGTSGPG
ncbi:MFS transporter [Streptomyces sp. VNUA116]|uniref:MFS transporter n=1 Tax=Streptomyces sp. VNUA116 TaxID=3062449 RepID=UPI002675B47D|nr:MFS transporter [Streptomyces sp. VNUA116]WKU48469.1 MFS transporter [Streptomyces sp. VNUA116]